MKMPKIPKTDKSVIYLGSALIIVAALTLAFFGGRQPAAPQLMAPAQELEIIAGARANSYVAPVNFLEITENDLLIGPREAKLKIFVYEDFASPFSAHLATTLAQIRVESEDDVALVIRPFVSPTSPFSQQAALAFVCAKEQDEGEEMRVKMFKAVLAGGLEEGTIVNLAQESKLYNDSFVACLTNNEKSVKLEEAMTLARNNLVIGAPTIFIGDEMIVGDRPYSDFVDSNGDAIEGLKSAVLRHLSSKKIN